AVLKGMFSGVTDEPVSYVNAPQLAREKGVEVRESATSTAHNYVNLISLRGGDHAIAGTLIAPRGEPRIVMVDDHDIELPPSKHLLVVRNDDRKGMVALVSTALAEADINIADLKLGRSPSGEAALQVYSTDQPVPDAVADALRRAGGIHSAITLTDP